MPQPIGSTHKFLGWKEETPQPYTASEALEHKRLWGLSIYPKIFGFKYKDSIERNYKTRRERKE
jgi:hypothetical protein